MKTERCHYLATFSEFLQTSPSSVLGDLVSANHGSEQTTTIEAWEEEIRVMRGTLLPWMDEDAYIIFEYSIPRLGKRVDVVLLLQGIVFCIEFKAGKKDALQEDLEQVLDYALDLKNFHLYSADKPIAPILVPTQYTRATEEILVSAYDDGILNPSITGASSLQEILKKILAVAATDWTPESWGKQWTISPYAPTPTII